MSAPDLFDGQYWRGPRGKSIADILTEVKRELAKRKEVYPRWIEEGKISRLKAAYRVDILEDLVVLLEANIDK